MRRQKSLSVSVSPAYGEKHTTVYRIERSLSLDNVFLFSLLLAYFNVPLVLRPRVER